MGEENNGSFIKMKRIKKCEVCGSQDFKFMFEGNDKLLGIPGKFNLFTCKNCKVIFLNPQPSNKELKKYYADKRYYTLKKIDKNSRKLKFKIYLYDLYFNKKNKHKFEKIIFQPFKFIIRGTEIKKGNRLLDIGSGTGQFLYKMKQMGIDGYGIEPGEFDEKDAFENGLKIKKGYLKKGIFKKDFFDIITINHVLEHVNNPSEIINETKNLLKKEGLLIIGVPNTKSLSNKIFGKNWLSYEVPRHLINYSEKNLSTFLKKEGFKIKKIRYNSRPSQFVVSLYFLFGIKKREGFWNRVLEALFLPLTWIVNALKIGDQIEVWCVKK